MGVWKCACLPPFFSRKKVSGNKGENRKKMKGSTDHNSCGVAGNFIMTTKLRKKTLTLRDLLDLEDAIEKAIKNKVAKPVVPAIDVMFQALSEFGAKIVPPKRILKMLAELFDHQDQNVRSSSKGLTLELCRWIGKDPVKSIVFEKMRDTMKKELEAELVNVTGTAKATRKIRSEQDKELEQEVVSETAVSGPAEEPGTDAPQEIDEYELVDPVDILTPLEKSGFWEGVKASKWSERKEAVAELTKLASTKRIAPGDFTEICRTLKKEKLKEIKPTSIEALTQTLQAMHKSGCLNLVDIVEDVKTATKNKVPLVRSLALNWVTYCIETSNKAVILKVHKEYVPICMESLNDGTPEVRDAAFSALAAIAKLVGMRPLEKPLEKLDDVRKKKLSEMIGGSEAGQSSGSSSVTLQSSGGSVLRTEASDGSLVRRSAASMLSGKKPVPAAPSNKKGASTKSGVSKKGDGAAQSKISKPVEPEDVEPAEMSLEEIGSNIGSFIQADTIAQLKSAVWKEQLEAIGSFKEQVEAIQYLDSSVEILTRLLCAVPGWSEKNVQVQQQVIEVITHIASTASKFPKKCVVLCLPGISERVADIKTRAQAIKCVTTFCEVVGPGFIFDRLYKITKEHKNPKVLSEGILWMVSAVDDFGVSHLKLQDLIDFCKDTGLQSSAAAARNATIKLIGALHKFVGPDIKGFLSDVKPALLSALDAEYEKNPFEGASAAPKRAVKALETSSSSAGGGLDSLPREDVSGKITPTLLKGLESSDWKVRLECIESVNKILEEGNKRIQPTGTGELFGALRGRLYDSNKNLIMATLSTIGGVASAMGPAVEKASKGILADILKCLSDNKKHMRECTLTTLDSWLAAVHLDKMIPYITTALTDAKVGAEGRKDLFDWLSKQLAGITHFSDAIHLLKPAASAMTDKSAHVRKAAEGCFNEILRVCGREMVTRNLKDIQGSALAIVVERLIAHGAFQEMESGRTVSTGATSKTSSKIGKSNSHGVRASQTLNKAAPSRVIPSKGSRQESIMSVQDITIQSQALLNVKDSNKDERVRIIVRRFKFEELRLEQIQDLENDIMKYFREDLQRRLLSTDFKKQVVGIEMLQKALPSIKKEIIEVLDILLKWFVLRICESNTSCLLKVLEFLPELFDMLRNEGYAITEAEATIFLPCLMEKSGHNIEKVREKLQELMKQLVHAYSAAKAFPYILEGLQSRNSCSRIECADLVGFLLENHVAEISAQLKSLQIVASLTAERDGELRKAALNTLATGYKILGDDIWRYVGKLTDAQRSMLDDRFKWKAREMDKRKEGKPGEARAALRRSVWDNGGTYVQPELQMERHPMSRTFSGGVGPTDWNEALDIIVYGSPKQSEGMKVVCHELPLASNDPDGSMMDNIVKDADRLVSCLANKVAKTFDFSLTCGSPRSCKYVLNTLMQTFQNKRLANAVKESTLDILITELLLWLLDERVPRMDDGSQLLKALNVLMLKILDNADRTLSFVVLINLLRPVDPSRWPSLAANESPAMRNHKFSDLVVKCLIKLTKVLQSTIYEVDLDRVLQSIHIYLQELGMEEIRRRAGADDQPLRTVKTILHELVKLRGIAIKGHLSMVPIDSEPQPIILAYIDLNLQILAAARMLTPSVPVSQTHWGDSAANNSAPATHSADAQLKQELAAIFKKIGDKQTGSIGLYELYRITQLYPKVDIFALLQNASEVFRTYIRDGLAQMEKNAAAGRTPSSVPLSTPPPSALNLSSPKFGPLSPVNTNTLNDAKTMNNKTEPTNFSLPPAYADDNGPTNAVFSRGLASDQQELRQQFGEQRNDRLPTGVTSGTLDAIRERMKSMQLAAAAGTQDTGIRPLIPVNGNLVGMRPLEKSLEKLDDVRKKLSEMIGGSEAGQSSGSSSVALQSSGGSVLRTEASDGSLVRRSAASMLSGKKPVPSAPSNKKGASTKSGVSKKGDGGAQSKITKPVEPEDVEPAEMSLEEIESKIGSLIQADTIAQLKSAVWKEQLEAIGSFKEQVEAIQYLDSSVEILTRLLCAVPGWSEKNVQVQQQVIEVITHMASTASKFPKKCVVLCLPGISERVADIKTRTQAMKCMTTFCEVVGPGFIFDRLYKITKEHKNPKVLSEGILWMVSAVDDFGVSHLKLQDLIDFCKDTGLQSSAAAARNATIKLIGALHKFVGPDIKGFLSDVKPALLSALDAEYEKNPFEGASAAPKRAVKALETSSSSAGGGLDGLPREDVSGKITPTLLKGLESSDWKVRLECIESVNKILEEGNKRIQPTGTGELFGALRGRLYDSNKNLIMATLSTIGGVASAMGPAVEKASKGILADILKCLSDNKKHMRECTLTTLDSWLAAVHLDKMIPYITTALTDAKVGAEGRKDLFDWLSKQLAGITHFSDAIHLLKPAASAMTDKSAHVRKAAEGCFNEILRVCGREMVTRNLKDIQGSALAIVVERLIAHGAFQEMESGRTVSTGATSKTSSKIGKSNSHGVRASQTLNKAAPSRVIPSKGSRQESIMSVQGFTIQSQALVNVKDSNKDERERIIVRRFKFEELRLEQIQDLENDIMKYFREDLQSRLLSTDFKKQVDGIEMLQKALPYIKKEIIEVLDILLKWFVLRICESNTSCLLKVLEFLPELFDMLRNEGYAITEAEATIFLPCLMEKSGHNIEKVREKLRELMKKLVHAYSAAKTFPYILEGLRSRNNRSRIECADLVGFLLENHVAEISAQLKSLQIVASLTAERDGKLRKAAFNTLAIGYKILGDDIWRYVGKLTDAQRSMLDDRFKWKAREMDNRKEGKPGEARAALRHSVRDDGGTYVQPELQMERHPMSRTFSGSVGPTDWNEALDSIVYGSPKQSEGMKVVCHELALASNDPDGSTMDSIVKDADRLVSCLVNKVTKTFDFSLTCTSSRSCKYVLNTLMQTFQNKRLAYAVKESTLDSLITELLLWLLDERVPRMDDGSQLLKALNVLMLKILDNADQTLSFVVLINLLRPVDPSRWPSLAANESPAMRNQKFSDLVVRCLIKLTKVLQSTIYEVDLDRVLQSIHIYLQELGMEEIRRRAGADDQPLRMVKTVLLELVKLCGTAIKGHLSMVPIDSEPQPIILVYIDLNLEILAAARMLTPFVPVGQTHWGDSAANNSAPATHSADAQLKQELAAIFKKIGDKQTGSIGLYELYQITQLYPKVDIFALLQNASEVFRTYIRDGLAQMEKNAAAGRTPSSVPLSTPPPSALNLSSPKFGPLSPVNTNPLNDAKTMNNKTESTNFSLPPAYADDDRPTNAVFSRGLASDQQELREQFGEQRNDRLPSGVTSGTLDAIREWTKSMQLAAAAGTQDTGIRPLIPVNGNMSQGLSGQFPPSGEQSSAENPVQSGVLPMDEKALSGLQVQDGEAKKWII